MEVDPRVVVQLCLELKGQRLVCASVRNKVLLRAHSCAPVVVSRGNWAAWPRPRLSAFNLTPQCPRIGVRTTGPGPIMFECGVWTLADRQGLDTL